MAGKDDIRLLSSFVYTKVKGLKNLDDEVPAVGSVVMNRAISLGSLQEAVQSMNPTPELMEVMQGVVRGKGEKEYKKVIQLSSKLLRGASDPTGGAVELAPRHSRMDKTLNLVKTYATKNNNFYRPSAKVAGGVQEMPEVAI